MRTSIYLLPTHLSTHPSIVTSDRHRPGSLSRTSCTPTLRRGSSIRSTRVQTCPAGRLLAGHRPPLGKYRMSVDSRQRLIHYFQHLSPKISPFSSGSGSISGSSPDLLCTRQSAHLPTLTSGPSPTEFLTPYQLFADLEERLLPRGRSQCDFALPMSRWQVDDHL